MVQAVVKKGRKEGRGDEEWGKASGDELLRLNFCLWPEPTKLLSHCRGQNSVKTCPSLKTKQRLSHNTKYHGWTWAELMANQCKFFVREPQQTNRGQVMIQWRSQGVKLQGKPLEYVNEFCVTIKSCWKKSYQSCFKPLGSKIRQQSRVWICEMPTVQCVPPSCVMRHGLLAYYINAIT